MKKFLNLLIGAFLISGLFATTLSADPAKGQKVYLKYMKETTGLKGGGFATRHTQKEWEELFKGDGKLFIDETIKAFPKTKEFLEGDKFPKYMEHIKDFMINYASDSGNVPSC